MAKIMLVEDDDNLRQIYEDALKAEGHKTVTASDGEEALALAVKEKPDLILADIMMPKVSGFDMLDILRTTPETKDAKIVMMTALSQAEDKARAEKLGADRYLVKSQVTLQDVIKVIEDMIGQEAAAANQAVSEMTGDKTIATPAPTAPVAPTTAVAETPKHATVPPTSVDNLPIKQPGTTAKTPKPAAPASGEATQIKPQEVEEKTSPPTKINIVSPTPSETPTPTAPKPTGSMMTGTPTMAQGGAASQPSDDSSDDNKSEDTDKETPPPTTGQTMKHEKRIEPSADAMNKGPKLNEMLTNNEPAVKPPAVDSIISPKNGPTAKPGQNGPQVPPAIQ